MTFSNYPNHDPETLMRSHCATSCVLATILMLFAGLGSGCDQSASAPPASGYETSDGGPPIVLAKKELENGLVIEDLIDGEGAPCAPDATVEVEFTGMFEDGRIFDSSEMRRARLTIPLTRPSTIEGLRKGIPGMRPGGKRRIIIPWTLAYGEHGRDPIPPMANLTFEITLVRIVEKSNGGE